MKTNAEEDTKRQFKQEFEHGDLHAKWKGIYDRDDYWSKWARHRLEMALRSVDHHSDAQEGLALDVGIGGGRLLQELIRRKYRVYGTDLSYEMTHNGSSNVVELDGHPLKRLMVAHVESLPFRSERFDLVTCLGVLEYIRADRIAFSEFYRILRPGGCLVVAVASYHRLGELFGLLRKKLFSSNRVIDNSQSISLKDQVRMVKPLAFRSEAENAGFAVEEFRCFGGKLCGRYRPVQIYLPGLLYIGDHCLLVLRKPACAV